MKKLFNSFPIIWAIKFMILKLFRKLFKIEMHFAYSQTGEDLVIRKLLNLKKGAYYVDVGCNHPVRYSNTLNMYIDGGQGICIDANKELVDKYRRVRKRDTVVRAAISDVEEEVTFHISKDDLVSTVDEKTYEEWSKTWEYTAKETIRTETLNSILDKYLPENKTIDVLSIDVEGSDFKVLKSLDLNKYRPRFIVIEIHSLELLSQNSRRDEIVSLLEENDYKLMHYANINAYFVDLRN